MSDYFKVKILCTDCINKAIDHTQQYLLVFGSRPSLNTADAVNLFCKHNNTCLSPQPNMVRQINLYMSPTIAISEFKETGLSWKY